MGLTDMEARCRALLYWMWTQSQRDGEITSDLQNYLNQHAQRGTRPTSRGSQKPGIHAYISPGNGIRRTPKTDEALRTFRPRVYETLRTIKLATNKPREMRITLLYPTTDWDRVWSNLHETGRRTPLKRTGLRRSMTSFPLMSGYISSGARTRPSAPRVDNEMASCTG